MAARSRPARFRPPRVPYRPSPVAAGASPWATWSSRSASRTFIRTAMVPCFPIAARAAAWYRFAAERGHVESQLRLGRIFLHGASAMRLPEKWEQTARDGEMASATATAIFAATPRIERDTTQALFWLEKAAQQGQAEARALIGMIFFDGVGVEKDYARARENFMEAAEEDQPSSQFGLGEIYYRGLGLEPNLELGADWYQKAADLGHPRAQIAIATIYRSGEGRAADPERAAFYMAPRGGERRRLRRIHLWAHAPPWRGRAGRRRSRGDLSAPSRPRRDHLPATQALAAFYSQGGPVAPDLREAAIWYRGRGRSGGRAGAIHHRPLRRRGHRRPGQFYRSGALVRESGRTGPCDRRL